MRGGILERFLIAVLWAVVSVVWLAACADVGGGSPGDGPDAASADPVDASFRCGNGVVEGVEECDENDLGGATCATAGWAEGTLGCDLVTCRFDVSGCGRVETLQNDDNACTGAELGCSNAEGTLGNPQVLVECFNQANLAGPVLLTRLDYVVGDSIPTADSLDIAVHEWSGSGPPGAAITTVPLALENLAVGPQAVPLNPPLELPSSTFCVGFTASDEADAFRIQFSVSSTVLGATWMDASLCRSEGFVEGYTAFESPDITMGNLCVRPTIERMPLP